MKDKRIIKCNLICPNCNYHTLFITRSIDDDEVIYEAFCNYCHTTKNQVYSIEIMQVAKFNESAEEVLISQLLFNLEKQCQPRNQS